MPAGFSFAVLIQLAWLLGVYQRRIRPEGIVRQALFTTCFPYALSGPLVRYEEMGPQLDALEVPQAEDLARGLGLMVLGLAKKVLLADSLAPAADAVFHAAAQGLPLSTAEAWLGALSYTFQIYFDFSGYTDMAVGAALMLGLRLPENFAAPYKATGIVDFWRRWHMTLGRWLHDCLYQPLGGSRHGRVRQYANLLLTMLVCGVWHGAGLTFLLWGALHGLLLLVNHAFRHLLRGSLAERVLALPPLRALCVLVTFLCLTVAWVLFRAGDTGTALHVWQSMFLWSDGHPLPLQQGLEALLPGGLLEPRLLLPLLAVCAVIVWALPCSQHVMLGRADGSPSLAALAAEPALGRGSGPACAGLPAADAGPCLPFFPLLTEALMSEIAHPAPDGWLKRFFLSLVILALLAGLLLLVPWAVCWLTASGELDQEEVVARQAQGEFVLFGPGLAQDIMAYKLALYAAVKPEVVVLGSSRAGNVRAAFFERPFVNMAGAAMDLESLRLLVDRMLAVHRPRVVLLGLDFWWLTAGAPAGRPERIPCSLLCWMRPPCGLPGAGWYRDASPRRTCWLPCSIVCVPTATGWRPSSAIRATDRTARSMKARCWMAAGLRRIMPLPARCASWKAAAASGPGALRRTGNVWKPLPRSAAACVRAASAPSSSCRPWPRPYWAPLPTGTAVMPAGCPPCGRDCWTAAWRAWIFRIPASTAPAIAR